MVFDAVGSKGEGQIIVDTQPGGRVRSAELRLPDGREFQLK
jgi:hypothetical protein